MTYHIHQYTYAGRTKCWCGALRVVEGIRREARYAQTVVENPGDYAESHIRDCQRFLSSRETLNALAVQ